MAQTLSLGRLARSTRSVRTGGMLDSALTYITAAGAARRTAVAVEGRRIPAEHDLRTLGIDRTPAYAAVLRR